MEIKLFTALTTVAALVEIEVNSKKYHEGFFADMNNAPERKIVKESAATIQTLIKKVDRARIDLAKDYKRNVESEAKEIIDRLKVANEPFTLLIDEFNAERKKELDAEKAGKKAIEDAVKLEADHDYALILNLNWDNEQTNRIRESAERERMVLMGLELEKKAAVEQAKQQLLDEQESIKARQEQEEAERLANKQYLASVHRAIVETLTGNGLSDHQAKTVVRLMAKGKLAKVTINY